MWKIIFPIPCLDRAHANTHCGKHKCFLESGKSFFVVGTLKSHTGTHTAVVNFSVARYQGINIPNPMP